MRTIKNVRHTSLWLALAALLPLVALSTPSKAKAFTELKAPAAYTAEVREEGMRYEALLRLREGHWFILHERLTLPNGAEEIKSRTGFWRQVDGGALLQLVSRDAFVCKLNVGGENALYGEVHRLGVRPLTAAFRAAEDKALPFEISGWLAWEGENPVLRDAATDRRFFLHADPRLEELGRGGDSFHVEVWVEEDAKALRLLRLNKAIPRESGRQIQRRDFFAATVDGGHWWINAKGLPPLSAAFLLKDSAEGTLEVSGPGVALRAAYKIDEAGIAFQVEENHISPLPTTIALTNLLHKVRHWDVEGDVFVLSHETETLCILEKKDKARAFAAMRAQEAGRAEIKKPPRGQERPLWNWSRQ